jgi:hypothetical protein
LSFASLLMLFSMTKKSLWCLNTKRSKNSPFLLACVLQIEVVGLRAACPVYRAV